eukprot:g1794.t1
MGRLKRQKVARKTLNFFRITYGIRAPYKVLLDGNFLHVVSKRSSASIRDMLSKLLGEELPISIEVPAGVIGELESLGKPFESTLQLAKSFKITRGKRGSKRKGQKAEEGNHDDAADSIGNIVGPRNSAKYIVCTQDEALRSTLAQIPGVPLMYLNRTVLVLEPPSSASVSKQSEIEMKKAAPRKDERRRLHEQSELQRNRAGGGKAMALKSKGKKRRRGPKQPNPLSVKKKKKKKIEDKKTTGDQKESGGIEVSTNGGKRKRRRKKKSEESVAGE